jgi:hypothetical protein
MVEPRVQRRLAAILAADVVGYSRLMEIDEAGTLVRLKLLRREIVDPAKPWRLLRAQRATHLRLRRFFASFE